MKRLLIALVLLLALIVPVHAASVRPSRAFAEMVILGADRGPDGTWIVRAKQRYDYFVMARGQFDFIEQWWLGMYQSAAIPMNCYLPELADIHENGVYIWNRPGWKGITWLVPNHCVLHIQMVTETPKGARRLVTDSLSILVLPAE